MNKNIISPLSSKHQKKGFSWFVEHTLYKNQGHKKNSLIHPFNTIRKNKLPLIKRYINKHVIHQTAPDGYINASRLCITNNTSIENYLYNAEIKKTLQIMSDALEIPLGHLIQKNSLISKEQKDYWLHPYIAINLGQWLGHTYSFLISKWVVEWYTGEIEDMYRLPIHTRRYLINRKKIPYTHFSILDLFISKLFSLLEELDYSLPNNLIYDFALGKMFNKWLKKQGYDPEKMLTYTHFFDDGIHQPVQVKLYPNALLYKLSIQIDKWIRNASIKYFFEKDKYAMPSIKSVILDKIIEELPKLKK